MIYKFKDKEKAIKKFHELFEKKIINQVYTTEDNTYIIDTIEQKKFYQFQLENQKEMDFLKEHLLNQFI